MRKIVFGLFAMLLLGSIAAVGPEAPNPLGRPLILDINKNRGNPHTVWSRTVYPERLAGQDGWDLGGRSGYSCGFMELVDGGSTSALSDDTVIAKVVAEHYGQGGFGVNIQNDPDNLYAYVDTRGQVGGDEHSCSAIGTTASPGGTTVPASAEELSRSFGGPGEPSFAHGHVLQIWQDGVEVGRVQTPHAEDEFQVDPDGPAGGVTSWWFKGDADGEIIMWYLNSDVTPSEYGIVARLSAVPMAPGITVDDCVLNNPQGTPCPQEYPNQPAPPPSDATGSANVNLSDGRVATVDLTVPGFFPPAPEQSCGSTTVILADGRQVDATICA